MFKLKTTPFSLYNLKDKIKAQSLILAFKKAIFPLGKPKYLMSRYKSSYRSHLKQTNGPNQKKEVSLLRTKC